MIRILIVGELRFYREGLAHFLGGLDHVAVSGTAATAAEAVEAVAESEPDVVLLDVARRGRIGDLAVLRRSAPAARVVVLGVPEVEREILEYAEEGMAGYVGRDASLEDLVRTIEAAARDELACTPGVAAALLRRVAVLAAGRRHDEVEASLTARELEIVGLIDGGLSNKQIATELHIQVPTVKNHVHHILEKLHVARRADVVTLVRRGALHLRD